MAAVISNLVCNYPSPAPVGDAGAWPDLLASRVSNIPPVAGGGIKGGAYP